MNRNTQIVINDDLLRKIVYCIEKAIGDDLQQYLRENHRETNNAIILLRGDNINTNLRTHVVKDDIALVPLVSLTTGLDRQKRLIDGAEGFIYAVAINGVTGKTGNYRDDLDKHLANLTAHADIPVLTGFGVSTEEDIKRFNAVSDGVIVGSKIVRDLHDGKEEEVAEFVTFGSHFEI